MINRNPTDKDGLTVPQQTTLIGRAVSLVMVIVGCSTAKIVLIWVQTTAGGMILIATDIILIIFAVPVKIAQTKAILSKETSITPAVKGSLCLSLGSPTEHVAQVMIIVLLVETTNALLIFTTDIARYSTIAPSVMIGTISPDNAAQVQLRAQMVVASAMITVHKLFNPHHFIS